MYEDEPTRNLVREALHAVAAQPSDAMRQRVHDVLEHAGQPRRRPAGWSRRRMAFTGTLLIVTVGLLALALPPARGALAATGVWQSIWTQLYGGAGDSSHAESSATSQGFTVRALPAYDDGYRVVVGLVVNGSRCVRHDSCGLGNQVRISDSAGHDLRTGDVGGGEIVAARPEWGPGAGTPITIHIDGVFVYGTRTGDAQRIAGNWMLRVRTLPSAPPHAVATPAGATSDGVTVSIDNVRVSDAYLSIGWSATGPLNQAGSVYAQVLGPDGHHLAPLLLIADSTSGPVQIGKGGPPPSPGPDGWVKRYSDYQLASQPGTYHLIFLTMSVPGGGGELFERDITIDHGRPASIPTLIPRG